MSHAFIDVVGTVEIIMADILSCDMLVVQVFGSIMRIRIFVGGS
jgi:hypothetical protein